MRYEKDLKNADDLYTSRFSSWCWQELKYRLSDSAYNYASLNSFLIAQEVLNTSVKDYSDACKVIALCCAYHQSTLDDETLRSIMTHLKIPSELLCCIYADTGRTELLKTFLARQSPEQKVALVLHNEALVVTLAVQQKNLDILDILFKIPNIKAATVVKNNHYVLFHEAVTGGDMHVVGKLMASYPSLDQIKTMLASRYYSAVHTAARMGHIDLFKQFLSLMDAGNRIDMIKMDNYRLFVSLVVNGDAKILNLLWGIPGLNVVEMIEADNFKGFRAAAYQGQWSCMQMMMQVQDIKVIDMVNSNNHDSFKGALQNHHNAVIRGLLSIPGVDCKAMIRTHMASIWDCLIERKLFEELMSYFELQEIIDLVTAQQYRGFKVAALKNRVMILECLLAIPGIDSRKMLEVNIDAVLEGMAANNRFAFFEALKKHFGEPYVIALAVSSLQKNYHYFTKAIGSRSFECFDIFLSFPGLPVEVIKDDSYKLFDDAAVAESFYFLDKLLNFPDVDQKAMLIARGATAFTAAFKRDRYNIIEGLIKYVEVFAYAESHMEDFKPFIFEQVALYMNELRSQHQSNANAVFDLTPATADYCFYIIRNLIRRNNDALLDDIQFLLQIPSVRDLASTHENALVQLALRIGNRAAADLLLNINAVRELYGRTGDLDLEEGLGLRAQARSTESSLEDLSDEQKRYISDCVKYYQPLIEGLGIDNLFNSLIITLEDRYQRHPATITINSNTITLPLGWAEFQKVSLTSPQRQEALKAYYQNKTHTALRYLSKPNLWIAESAEWVYVSLLGDKYSTFEQHRDLIAILWCAVKDSCTKSLEGHILDGRISHFIDELALIGRAHNWDMTRIISGTPQEFDDLEGDKPSCASGVRKRLLQSVIGHPLFTKLTIKIIENELRDFVRDHFITQINENDKEKLLEAWHNYLISVEFNDAQPLCVLDISQQQQMVFIKHLHEKYGEKFTSEPSFEKYIQNRFTLTDNVDVPFDCIHALKFDGLVGFGSLLTQQKANVNRSGMFSNTNVASSCEAHSALAAQR